MQNKRYCFPFFLGIPAGYQITYGDKRWRFRRWCHVRMAKRGLSHPQQASIRVQFKVKPILEQKIILGNQLFIAWFTFTREAGLDCDLLCFIRTGQSKGEGWLRWMRKPAQDITARGMKHLWRRTHFLQSTCTLRPWASIICLQTSCCKSTCLHQVW